MNNEIEIVEPTDVEYISPEEFKLYVKSMGARLKVVAGHYRWVYQKGKKLVMVLPQELLNGKKE